MSLIDWDRISLTLISIYKKNVLQIDINSL